jgi:hypothetical protein
MYRIELNRGKKIIIKIMFMNIPQNFIEIPRRVGLLGYGAVGKVFVEILLKEYPGKSNT